MDNMNAVSNLSHDKKEQEVRMTQSETQSPRALFLARTTPAPYVPTDKDKAWVLSMKTAPVCRLEKEAQDVAASGNLWRLTRLLDMQANDVALTLPLHMAVERGHTGAAALLLARGADVNGADAAGGFALVKAVKKGDVQMACLLLHYNADADATDANGRCARQLAQMNPVMKSVFEETALPRCA